MKFNEQLNIWFVTGSQHLYGEETLKLVEKNSKEVADGLAKSINTSVKIIFKTVLTTPEAIYQTCLEANNDNSCIGLITWMHTFSPSKMWISGLSVLNKPFAHFHTQFNRDIPWTNIDMDFMNTNQSAHGGREFGFINARMGIDRKVIVGHWQDKEAIAELDTWIRAALGRREFSKLKVARFGDNMRSVAVTEGNKVSAEIQFGVQVHGYGVGDLVEHINSVSDSSVDELFDEYKSSYIIADKDISNDHFVKSVKDAAKIELGIRSFLSDGGFHAFTTTFEDLHGMTQLPGISAQRLMQDGYGFGGEGDWKTSALLRVMKVMANGLNGGTSFMEDYTYHFDPKGMRVLGAHMLEICPSIANGKPKLEVYPLSIGGKADPARLVFSSQEGEGINVALMDMGNRFRMLINKVNSVASPDLPKLPVARILWDPYPNLKVAAGTWILGGGAHHTVFTQALTVDHMVDFAEMMGIECVVIDENTTIPEFKKELKLNEVYYHIAKGIR